MTSAAAPPSVASAAPAASVRPSLRGPAIRRRGVPTLLAAAGGLALYLAFPSHDLSLLAVLGPAALSLVVYGRGLRAGGWLGFVFGLAYLTPLLSWTGVYVGAWPWLLLALWQAGYLALLGPALVLVQRLPLWPLWAACLWVADEALRSRWFLGGFPWGRLGVSQADSPFTAYAAYGGVPLLSVTVALCGTLLAAALVGATRATRSAPPAAAGLLAAALAVPAVGALLPVSAGTDASSASAVIAVVQGDVPEPGLNFNARRRAVLDNHVDQTIALAARVEAGIDPRPDLVIWPENASDIDPYRNADAAEQIDRAARAVGVPILVGAVVVNDDDTLGNVGIVWDPLTGPGQTYLKRHPVPFGEYIPFRSLLERVAPIVNEVPRDFVGGDRPGLLDAGGVSVGDVICFEVAYDGLVGDVVDAGAQVLVVQTNNATFGYTDETYQQLAMGRIRAVEHGRSVLVASTSGVSAIIAPDGSVSQQSGLFTPDVFVQAVELRTDRTLASRLGSTPEWSLTAAGLTALAIALWRSRRRPSQGVAQ
ncbi:MAG: apolipoprotein N-acyltransferase [Geodermatophilaceae bacterium]